MIFYYGQTVTQEPLGTILTLITSPGNKPEAEYVDAVSLRITTPFLYH